VEGDPTSINFPIPLRKRKDCDLSYAGLKTAVQIYIEKKRVQLGLKSVEQIPRKERADIAASFQNVAIKHVEQRLETAMDIFEEKKSEFYSLAVVGGVAANMEIRHRLKKLCNNRKKNWSIFLPMPKYCTDQGIMTAWSTIERIMVGSSDSPDDHNVFARYPFKAQQ